MKTILVTGAKGALGQSVVTFLRETGKYQIIATSRYGDNENIFSIDVSNQKQVSEILNRTKPDLILHMAATFVNEFDEAYAVNVDATHHLLDVVKKSGVNIRILLVGSAAEYGVIQPQENPIKEEHALNPVSIYGLTKAWQTQLAMLYASQDMDVVVARVFNLSGEGLSDRLFVGRLQKQIDDVLMGIKSTIELGPLSATRDYLSLEEAAEQILAIAEHGSSGHIYHVASGIPVTMRELLNHHLFINNLDASIVHESPALTNRTGYDVPVIYADISKTLQLMQRRTETLCQS